jgi:hypothetical protein
MMKNNSRKFDQERNAMTEDFTLKIVERQTQKI